MGLDVQYPGNESPVTGETTEDPDPIGLNGAPCAPAEDCLGPGLVVPAGQTTRITLVSNDVIHGFYVPEFNFSRYAQPGVTNVFDLTVDQRRHLPGPVHPAVRAVPLAHVLPRGGAAPRPVPGVAERSSSTVGPRRHSTVSSSTLDHRRRPHDRSRRSPGRRHEHEHEHHEGPSGLLKWLTSTDHKVIGMNYMVTSLVMFFLAGIMALAIAGPAGQPPTARCSSFQQYNALFTMHGSLMLYLFAGPFAFGGLANYILPLQVGAPDMAFPRLNALSYWLYLSGSITMLLGFLVAGGAAAFGWVGYAPLSTASFSPGIGTGPVDPRHRPDRVLGHLHRRQPGDHDVLPAGPGHDHVPAAPSSPGTCWSPPS